jgi:hypothetical protein
MRVVCVSLAATLLLGLQPLASSAEETADRAPQESAAESPADESATASQAAPATESSAYEEAVAAEDREFKRLAATYKRVKREGKELYCRREKPLGSRLPVESCLTEVQLRANIRTAQDARDKLRLPGGAPCGSSFLKC